jgi:hypothetical protein
MLVQSLLAGDSVKKAAARVGTGNDLVTQFLLDAGAACREYHDRTVMNLALDSVRCQRVWGFSYVRRRNAYTPEINRGIPREGWAWVALHAKSGLVVDWTVATGDAPAAKSFISRVRERLAEPSAVKARGRDIILEKGVEDAGEATLLTRLFGMEHAGEPEEGGESALVQGDFRRRCLNLELALSLHFTSRNFLADTAKEPPAVQLGLVPEGWSLEALAACGEKA